MHTDVVVLHTFSCPSVFLVASSSLSSASASALSRAFSCPASPCPSSSIRLRRAFSRLASSRRASIAAAFSFSCQNGSVRLVLVATFVFLCFYLRRIVLHTQLSPWTTDCSPAVGTNRLRLYHKYHCPQNGTAVLKGSAKLAHASAYHGGFD